MKSLALRDKVKKNDSSRKVPIFVIGFFIVVCILVFLALSGRKISTSRELNKKTNTSETSGGALLNPMVRNTDLEGIENKFKEVYQKNGKKYPATPQYHFDYKVAPVLSEKKRLLYTPIIGRAFAVSGCNLTTAPDSVTGYLLESHYSISDAKKIASAFIIDTTVASSIPDVDGISFKYYFSDPKTSAYFSIAEPSGVYQFHSAEVSESKPDISQGEAQKISTNLLKTHSLGDKLKLVNSTYSSSDPKYEAYMFSYDKNFSFTMVDTVSISSLGSVTSACTVERARTMNYVDVLIGKKGDLGKIVNQTRSIKSSYSVSRESIDDAVAEYKDSLPVPPIVIGGGNTTDTVTLDEAILVYYDFGEPYAMYAYIPMYLTSGKTSAGKRVFTLFPAVSMKKLEETPLAPSEFNNKTLQLDTFNPAPPPPPGKLCWGNQVDYIVSCSLGATQVCSGVFGLSTALENSDPYGVCEKGCQSKEGVIAVAAGQEPCKKFLEKHGIPTDNLLNIGTGNVGGTGTQKSFPGGDVRCVLNGCPC